MVRWAIAAIAMAFPYPSPAQELQGADAAIRRLTEKKGPAKPEQTQPKNRVEVLRNDLEGFRGRHGSLTAADAANQWIGLAARYFALAQGGGRYGQGQPLEFKEVIAAIPPPAAWNAVANAITARYGKGPATSPRAASMRLIADLLREDRGGQTKDVAALESIAIKSAARGAQIAQSVMELSRWIADQSGDPNRILKAVEMQIAVQQAQQRHNMGSVVSLPNLVGLVGPEAAERLLRRILVTSPVEVYAGTGAETRKLAMRLALELVSKLKAPQWALANSLDAGPLYESLEKRFGTAKAVKQTNSLADAVVVQYGQADSRTGARVYYILGLITSGRTTQAVNRVLQAGGELNFDTSSVSVMETASYPTGPLEAVEQAGYNRELFQFLHALLSRNPNLSLWPTYIRVSARAGKSGEMLKLIQSALAKPGLSVQRQRQLREHHYQALLAADQVTEGVAILKRVMDSSPQMDMSGPATRGDLGLKLARIGHLLNRPEWVEEGLRAARAVKPDPQRSGSYFGKELAAFLWEVKRPAEAEQVLLESIAPEQPGMMRDEMGMVGRDELVELTGLYSRMGRHKDVLKLLEGAPNWGAKDLADISVLADSRDTPLGYMAAAALASTDQKEEAKRILQAVLQLKPVHDPSYELLISLSGDSVLPFLEKLRNLDRFEERPLMWKASVLLKLRRLDEAEKAAREAIAIDPSDGEQRFGRRMRVYGILADILDARGDGKQAEVFRGAVRAIRIAERADELYAAGLLQRGIKMYKEALTHFSDAYCIQSRLAVQLMEAGQVKEAEEHYRRAYELMPASFGRMESHCFGCEGVFRGKRAQTIAERVFKELTVKQPQKPQVHYLLGYLREEQGRFREALQSYRQAVALDQDYVNAWQRLHGMGEHTHMPPAERDSALLHLLRLRPLHPPALNEVGNLRRLWTAVASVRRDLIPGPPATLHPLPASAPAAEKMEAQFLQQMGTYSRRTEMRRYLRMQMGGMSYGSMAEPLPTPGEAVSSQKAVAAAAQIIDSTLEQGGVASITSVNR